MTPPLGKLYGLSVGPGDPELITLKALNILQSSPVISFPQGIKGRLGIAQRIAQQYFQPHQIQLELHFPYVLDMEVLHQAWEDAAKELIPYLQQGQNIAFLCEGDINFYGSFTYLAQAVQRQLPHVTIETVGGVCSPMALASIIPQPLTIRDEKLLIIPTLYHREQLAQGLTQAEVVILMKVASSYGTVWQLLKEKDLLTRSLIIERATFPEQKVYQNLEQYPDLQLNYFSILAIFCDRAPLA
jgi:precorrin-2/cobalt-factor-2 C20-methyltransferase